MYDTCYGTRGKAYLQLPWWNDTASVKWCQPWLDSQALRKYVAAVLLHTKKSTFAEKADLHRAAVRRSKGRVGECINDNQ